MEPSYLANLEQLLNEYSAEEIREYGITIEKLAARISPKNWGKKENEGYNEEGYPDVWGSQWWVEVGYTPGELREYPYLVFCFLSNAPGSITARHYEAL